ncbi:MAG TPA: hypothetical protein VJP86_15445 [Vicinamibacterales bacterium]|nr:hypothetical protein [Vicinamibacterales bacterium]
MNAHLARVTHVILTGLAATLCLTLTGCNSQPDPADTVLSPADRQIRDYPPMSVEQAIRAVQAVPGTRSYALGVESPDSVRQGGDHLTASADMTVNGEKMTMHFVRRGQTQWEWKYAMSPKWSGQTRTPPEVVQWLAAQKF